jgi:hypothetical protein
LLWLLPAVVAMRIFREKGYSWGWLAAGVVPFLGLPLLCLALLLPDMRPDAEANPRPLLKLSNLAGFGLVVTNVLSGLVAVGWLLLSSLAGPGPLPGLQDPRVTAELQQQVANLPQFRTQTAELGVPEVVAVSELMSPPVSNGGWGGPRCGIGRGKSTSPSRCVGMISGRQRSLSSSIRSLCPR